MKSAVVCGGRSQIVMRSLICCLMAGMLAAQTRLTKTPRPAWIENPGSELFVGISQRLSSEADAVTNATNHARRQIIESLGSIIESELIDIVIEKGTSAPVSDALMEAKIKLISHSIIAVKPQSTYIETWQEKSKGKKVILYQAFVAVPFAEAAHRALMTEMVTESEKIGRNEYQQARQAARNGLIRNAIGQLQRAITQIDGLTGLTDLAPADRARLSGLRNECQTAIETICGGFRFEISGAQQPARLGKALAEPLAVRLYWQEGAEQYPIPNVGVRFEVESGRAVIASDQRTDANGTALCRVREIQSAGNIRLRIDLDLPAELPFTPRSGHATLLSRNRAIVKIFESNLDRPVDIPYLENTLKQRLTQKGFSLLGDESLAALKATQIESYTIETIQNLLGEQAPDLVIIGRINSYNPTQVKEGFFFAWGRGILKLFNTEEKRLIRELIADEKNAGNSPDNAGGKAIKAAGDRLIQQLFEELHLE